MVSALAADHVYYSSRRQPSPSFSLLLKSLHLTGLHSRIERPEGRTLVSLLTGTDIARAAAQHRRMERIVILGAGHAGFQCAAALRQNGYAGAIVLVGDEDALPYQRPPLSKGYLLGKIVAADLAFRPQRFYAEQRIELHKGHAEAIVGKHGSVAQDDLRLRAIG
jgi:hypothetical protein